MKAQLFLCSLLGLSPFILASPLHLSATANSDRNTSIAASIGYEPDYINFEQKPKRYLQLAQDAVKDAYHLAYLAKYESQGLVLARYFDENFHPTVKDLYALIVDEKGKGQKRMADIKIDGDGESHTLCDPGARLKAVAVTVGKDNPHPTILLCHSFFNGPTLADIKLKDLGDRVSGKMDSVGATLVHEFTHWYKIGEAATGNKIIDYGISGYGPYNCRFVLPQSEHIKNADDYGWYATENYWTIQNNKSLFKSPTQSDNQVNWCDPPEDGTCVAM